jgi:hypothetical protein
MTITAPTGTTPSVVVAGPQSYSKTVTSSTTLTGLPPGSYTVSAATVLGHDSIVPAAYVATVTGSPASVTASATATATVTYAVRPGSGAAWVVGGFPYVNGGIPSAAQSYSAAQLRSTGAPTPVTTLTLATTASYNLDASDAVFDSAGDLWIANQNSNTVVEFTPAQLAASGGPTPAITITMPSDSAGPIALRFDAHHNLWVVNQWAGTIIELTSTQLVSGTAAPTVTIHDGPPEHANNQIANNPVGIAIDASGNVWIAHQFLGTVIEYSASQLTASGSPTPAVTLSPNSTSGSAIVGPTGLAFDNQGNLWIAGLGIHEIAASALTSTGSPLAVRSFTPPQGAHSFADYATGVTLDDSGNLWFSGFDYGIIGEYTAAQIAAGGDPAPAVEITMSGKLAPIRLAFDR